MSEVDQELLREEDDGDIEPPVALQALADVRDAICTHRESYIELLNEDPPLVADRLDAYADRLEKTEQATRGD